MYKLTEILYMPNRINQNTVCIDFIFLISIMRSSPNRITVDRDCAYLKRGHPRIKLQLTEIALILKEVIPESNYN